MVKEMDLFKTEKKQTNKAIICSPLVNKFSVLNTDIIPENFEDFNDTLVVVDIKPDSLWYCEAQLVKEKSVYEERLDVIVSNLIDYIRKEKITDLDEIWERFIYECDEELLCTIRSVKCEDYIVNSLKAILLYNAILAENFNKDLSNSIFTIIFISTLKYLSEWCDAAMSKSKEDCLYIKDCNTFSITRFLHFVRKMKAGKLFDKITITLPADTNTDVETKYSFVTLDAFHNEITDNSMKVLANCDDISILTDGSELDKTYTVNYINQLSKNNIAYNLVKINS